MKNDFWKLLEEMGAFAIFSRIKVRDGNEELNRICEEAYIKELKERAKK